MCQWRAAIKIIFSLLMVSLKGKGKAYKQKNTGKDNRKHDSIKTVTNFFHILFCRYYVDFRQQNLFAFDKNKIQQQKGEKSI